MGSCNCRMMLGSREMRSWNCVVGLKNYRMGLGICRMILGNCGWAGGGNGAFWGFLGLFGDGARVIFTLSPKSPIIDTVY